MRAVGAFFSFLGSVTKRQIKAAFLPDLFPATFSANGVKSVFYRWGGAPSERPSHCLGNMQSDLDRYLWKTIFNMN